MAVHFNLEKINNYKEVCFNEDGTITDLTNLLIILQALHLGFPDITEDNVDEVFCRLRLWEKAFGESLIESGEMRRVTYKEVRQHIGLHTNAAVYSRRQFDAHVLRNVKRDIERELKRQKEELKASIRKAN